ncbi:hypothetical protein GCM10012278_76050 [Nonomuraea glycinis]|uniref:Uncharacterized protein n=1 Tax=Nonomuraea glycinis TaxID=2047744 RepID=A0A918E8W5_9ACTN|nr:hypothetical protein GCM10012278_76050 [Nonomuraea glycinis]
MQPEVLRRQSLRNQEAFDSDRIPDDRQAITVTNQLNLVIHQRLLNCGQGSGFSQLGGGAGVRDDVRVSVEGFGDGSSYAHRPTEDFDAPTLPSTPLACPRSATSGSSNWKPSGTAYATR